MKNEHIPSSQVENLLPEFWLVHEVLITQGLLQKHISPPTSMEQSRFSDILKNEIFFTNEER